jgi:preprotein translocase subunit SecB
MSGYKIENLLLMNSSFSREVEMELDPLKVNNKVNVNVQSSKPDGKLLVIVTVSLEQLFGESAQAQASVTMIGVFQKSGDSELNEEAFVNVNAPAIIYPFIREQIATLFLKGGCGSVLLPPFNFAAKRD